MSYRFRYTVISISCNSKKPIISFLISVLTWFSFSSELFGFHEFEWTLPLVIASIYSGQIGCIVLFPFPCICWEITLCPSPWSIWSKLHDLLRIRYILLFCKYLLGPFSLWCCLAPVFLWLVFLCLMCLLLKLWYWSHLLSLCESQYVILTNVVVTQWTKMYLCLAHKCLELQCTLAYKVL